jgi:ATP-dependent helicase HrpA
MSFSDWDRRLAETMQCDRHRFRRMLREIGAAKQAQRPFDKMLAKFEEEFHRSAERRKRRLASLPKVDFDPELPIISKRAEIEAAIRDHPVVIVCGETGSGKSTQLPKLCLSLGRGVSGLIGHTQPRRVAARTIAARVADELQSTLGTTVGFKVRFTDATQPNTLIKLMTDGVLLSETRGDRFLDQYDTIIVDEAHERSLNIDFLLGYLKRLLPKRPDLKVIITSATIDAARFAEHFESSAGPAPILEVSGRMYPVEIRWQSLGESREPKADGRYPKGEEPEEFDESRAILDAVDELASEDLWDILIFQPTEWDIHETAKLLRGHCQRRGWTNDVEILPLYARLTLAEQKRVFEPHGGKYRIVIATNVAESSLTVPRVRSVIDTGTARISRYAPRSKMQRLPIEAISQASANQRTGRCGRIAPGVCIRLFDEKDFATREQFTPPEIVRTNLASVILQTESLNLGRLEEFPFLEPPKPTAIRDGYKTLFELGAVNERDQLTELGRKLAKLPVDPRIARIIIAGHADGCLHDILIIAAALEAQDPRDRPLDKQQAADEKHKQFQHPDSDFLSLLKLWDFFHHLKETLSKSQVRKACVQNFLNFNRMREWTDLHRQLVELVEQNGMKVGKRHWSLECGGSPPPSLQGSPSSRNTNGQQERSAAVAHLNGGQRQAAALEELIHRTLLTGFLASIANRDTESSEYSAAGGMKANVWPGSGTIGSKPKWIVAAELIETNKRYLRTVARIDPAWIESLAEHLVTRTHSEPHWDRAAGSAMAFERVSLFGLTIVPRRRIRLGRIDPATARRLLIQHGLVEREFDCTAPFFLHNSKLIDELEVLRVKSRRADFLKGEEALLEFYEQRIPADVVDGASLLKWCRSNDLAPQVRTSDPRGPNPKAQVDECASGPKGRDSKAQGKATNGSDALGQSDKKTASPEGAQPQSVAPSGLRPSQADHPGRRGSAQADQLCPGLSSPGPSGQTANIRQSSNDRSLFLSREDLLNPDRAAVSAEDFPETLKLKHIQIPLAYKLEPGEADDGITITVPQEGLNQLDPLRLGWLVPGLLEEKVIALIKSLPKERRRLFVPVPETAKAVLKQIKFGEGDVNAAVAAALTKLSGERIDASEIREDDLPPHLRISVKLLGANGKTLGVSRDLNQLRTQLGAKASASFSAIDHSQWNRDGLTDWDFDTLPPSVDLEHGGLSLKGYPSLVDCGENVSLRLADSVERAAWETHFGLRRLFVIAASKELTKQVKHLPDLGKWQMLTATLPDKGKLSQQLIELIAERAIANRMEKSTHPTPRTKSQFQDLVRSAKLQIPAAVQEVIQLIGPLLAAYTTARQAIAGCRLPFAQAAVADCQEQLARLTESGFLTKTAWDWLQQFPRYFQGIAVRLKKISAAGQARDQRAMSDIEPRWRKLIARLDTTKTTGRHDPELESCRWMLEELRVSQFAQELRTAITISPQRWDKQWEQLRSL